MAVTQVRYDAEGFGVGELWLDGDRVLAHELPRPRHDHGPNRPQGIPGIPAVTVSTHDARVCAESVTRSLVARLRAFFAGEDVAFDDVQLELDGSTPFQHELADALRAVPRGSVVTYGELAALARRPGAARAAGTFCARNRHALFIPCHRVVASAGIGGYGSLGTDYKRRLLALEGVQL